MPLRLLVLDGYARAGREALTGAGGTEAGPLYARLLARLAERDGLGPVAIDVAHPADGALALPAGRRLVDYAGVVWTGSSLTILAAEDPSVRRQIELARQLLADGIPCFGSCWAAQIAAVAGGGACEAHPRGREFGVSRDIRVSAEGRGHALFRHKPERFVAFTSHADHVASLAGTTTRRLAGNPWSSVQALAVADGRGRFWAVQYHPEYDPHEVACLARLRRDELVAQGSFADASEADRFIDDLETLFLEPSRDDLAARHGLDASVLDPDVRTREVANFLSSLAAGRD